MIQHIFLDSTPLGLILQRVGHSKGDVCRAWLRGHLANGTNILVPEIVDYEIRRELIRLGKPRAIKVLDAFNRSVPDRFLQLNSNTMRLAAELWAGARQRGMPTADRHALDIDVILAAQVLTCGIPTSDLCVATSNVTHLAQFVPAQEWSSLAPPAP
jgi:hypothetical protein